MKFHGFAPKVLRQQRSVPFVFFAWPSLRLCLLFSSFFLLFSLSSVPVGRCLLPLYSPLCPFCWLYVFHCFLSTLFYLYLFCFSCVVQRSFFGLCYECATSSSFILLQSCSYRFPSLVPSPASYVFPLYASFCFLFSLSSPSSFILPTLILPIPFIILALSYFSMIFLFPNFPLSYLLYLFLPTFIHASLFVYHDLLISSS